MLISNGVDGDIYFYEGGDSSNTFELSTTLAGITDAGFDFTSFGNVDEIIEFWNHLFYLNWTTSKKSVRGLAYADFGDMGDWVGGTSGSTILTDSIGKILRARKLGSDLIIYSEKSITTGRYLGANILFAFPTLIYETGLLAPKAIWDLANLHCFLGTDRKVYGYSGGRQLIDIGAAIEDALFDELDGSKKSKIVCGNDTVSHKLYFFIPLAGDTYAKTYYAWNYKNPLKPWEYGRFTHDVRDFGIFDTERDWYCDDDDIRNLYCDEEDFYCDSTYSQAGNAISIFISSTGYVYQLDEKSTHAGTNIKAIYDTEQVSPDKEFSLNRWHEVIFRAKSDIADSTLYVSYSLIDSHMAWSWTEVIWTQCDNSPVSLTSNWQTFRLPIDVLSRKIKIRFSEPTNKDFKLRNSIQLEYSKEGPQE